VKSVVKEKQKTSDETRMVSEVESGATKKIGMKKHCEQLLIEHAKLRGRDVKGGRQEMTVWIQKAAFCLLLTYIERMGEQRRTIENRKS